MIEISYADLYLICCSIIALVLTIYSLKNIKSNKGQTQQIIRFEYNEKHLTPLHEMIDIKTTFITNQHLVQLFNNDITTINLSKKITTEITKTLSLKYLAVVYGYISKQSLQLYIQQQVLTKIDDVVSKSNIKLQRDDGLDLAIESYNEIKLPKTKDRPNQHKGL